MNLTRRLVVFLPLAAAACGGDDLDENAVFPPLRYDYLPPIQLTVASIEVQQRFIPAGLPPDVSGRSPVNPIEALRSMAGDRLQAFGTANKAIFAILDASLTQNNDVFRGNFAVSLTIVGNDNEQLGFAQAHVSQTHTGRERDVRRALYDMTKSIMDDMNIELEYQIRRNLKSFVTTPAAPDTPVQQDSLDLPAPRPNSQLIR